VFEEENETKRMFFFLKKIFSMPKYLFTLRQQLK